MHAESPLGLFHYSYREILVDMGKRATNQFWVDEKEAHKKLGKKPPANYGPSQTKYLPTRGPKHRILWGDDCSHVCSSPSDIFFHAASLGRSAVSTPFLGALSDMNHMIIYCGRTLQHCQRKDEEQADVLSKKKTGMHTLQGGPHDCVQKRCWLVAVRIEELEKDDLVDQGVRLIRKSQSWNRHPGC